jgi:predicted nucleotidyltransferase
MKHWDFDVFTDKVFQNVNCIHPLKQKEVAEIVESAKQDSAISSIIVFGSAVRFDCNSASDIDIFVCRDDSKYKSPVDYGKVTSDVDVIYDFDCGDRLRAEIKETGVEVYRRDV